MSFLEGWPSSATEPVRGVGRTKETNEEVGKKKFRGGKDVTSVEMERRWGIVCLIKTNRMHFSFLIYSNNLSSTCFQYSNYLSSGGSYCVCST
jgi:hypothetical protein